MDFLRGLARPAIIDEAQYIPSIFRYLKILIDQDPSAEQFFITGSQNFALMEKAVESLTGRCAISGIEMEEKVLA